MPGGSVRVGEEKSHGEASRTDVESGAEHGQKSWQQRHGATIIAVVVVVMLALLIALNS